MRSKRDMYINYENSYKRRHGKDGKVFNIIMVVLLALGLGASIFFIIRNQINIEGKKVQPDFAKESPELQIDSVADQENYETATDNSNLQTKVPTPTTPDANNTVEKAEPPIPKLVKGIYVTASKAESEGINALIEIADTTEINTMVIDIKDDFGRITYAMDSPIVQQIGSGSNTISDMASLVKKLKEKDIYLIARIVAFKDPFLAEQRHDLAIKNKDGSLYRDNKGECWVNPYQKEVWEYLIEVATQAAAIGFDEIQFDYIRFSTEGGISKADLGEEAKSISKEEIIIEFTKYAFEKLKPLGVFISADVYGTIISSSIDAGLVGQNYVEMAKYLDYISPMIYPSHFGEGNYGVDYPDLEPYQIIRKVLTASKAKLEVIPEGEHRATVRPWLQDFTATWLNEHQAYGEEELREQIDGVYSVGYEEWLLWNSGCNYSVDGLLME